MLDINLFREGVPAIVICEVSSETAREAAYEEIKESQRRRFKDPGLVDRVAELDLTWRKARHTLDKHRKELNAISKQFASAKKEEKDTTELQEASKKLRELIAAGEADEKGVLEERDSVLGTIGNLVHSSVPIAKDEDHNLVMREVGSRRGPWHEGPSSDSGASPSSDSSREPLPPPPHSEQPSHSHSEPLPSAKDSKKESTSKDLNSKHRLHSHYELLHMLNIADLEAGQLIGGSRAYFLTDEGVLLNQALINYAIQFLHKRGYRPVQTPSFMTRELLAKTAQLSQFDEELYRLDNHPGADNVAASASSSATDRFLIATSEQPLSAVHQGQWIHPNQLPIK
eukprot:gene22063-29128_t